MPESVPKREREPESLSAEYHKARKQLMLWAAILFIWELVGIDLTKAESAEGYVGAIIRSIKSPQAVPWALVILVLYFLFKCSVEWAQCTQARRRVRFARIDFISAWAVSLAAFILYIGQAISRIQFADLFSGGSGWSLFFGLASGTMIGAIGWMFVNKVLKEPLSKFLIAIMIVELLGSFLGFYEATPIRWTIAVVSFAMISALLLGMALTYWILVREEKS